MLGLALHLEALRQPQAAGGPLQLPFQAAFTSMVPQLMQLAHK